MKGKFIKVGDTYVCLQYDKRQCKNADIFAVAMGVLCLVALIAVIILDK